MGREATCELKWGSESSLAKVLLESSELIVRGSLRRRVPISALQDVSVQGCELLFQVAEERVALTLGASTAVSWAKAIAKPPPALAAKLGISTTVHLMVVGDVSAPEVRQAITAAASVNDKACSLALACVSTLEELESAVVQTDPLPVWIVYPKGGKTLPESLVRQSLRARGYVDTKVASVSSTLVALRFHKTRA